MSPSCKKSKHVTLNADLFFALDMSYHVASISLHCPLIMHYFLSCSFHVAFISSHAQNAKNVTLNAEGIFSLDMSCHFALNSLHVPFMVHSFLSFSFHGVIISFHIPFILHLCPFSFFSFRLHVPWGLSFIPH